MRSIKRLQRFLWIGLQYALGTTLVISCSPQARSKIEISDYCGKVYIEVTTGMSFFTSPIKSYFLDIEDGTVNYRQLHLEGDELDWSPDGEWIVFSTLHTEGSRAGGNSEIYLAGREDDHVVQLSTYDGDDAHPTWSPDNQRVAFVSGNSIQVMDVGCFKDSDNCKMKPNEIDRGSYPAWSPNGELISYTQNGDVYLAHSGGEGEYINLTTGLYCYQSAWSLEGERIIMNCNGDIYQINIDGTGLVNLTNGIGNNLNPQWSPDGRKIFFISNWDDENLGKTLDRDGSVISNALFSMNPDGTEVTRVSPNDDEYVLWYTWTPECINVP